MDLQPYTLDGKQCHGAWVEIILFLQSLLSLETVHLNGVFSSKVDEVWCSQNPGEHYYAKSLKSWVSAWAVRTRAPTRLKVYVSSIRFSALSLMVASFHLLCHRKLKKRVAGTPHFSTHFTTKMYLGSSHGNICMGQMVLPCGEVRNQPNRIIRR